MRTTKSVILASVLVLLPAVTARCEDPSSWIRELTINGFASVAYSYNFNKPASATNAYRVFDFDDNSFKIDVAEIVIQKAATAPGETGFRVDLEAGASIPRVEAAAGLFRDSDGSGHDFDVQQAYVIWVAPVGRGLALCLGKHVTHTGSEVVEGYDGWNGNYSRGLLFGYAQPTTHTGLRGTMAFSDQVSGMFLIANGWDNVKDNNRGKTWALGATVTPIEGLSIATSYMAGAEQEHSSDKRKLVDVVVNWQVTSALSFGMNYDWAKEDFGGDDARWSGLALYGRMAIGGGFALNVRAEYLEDLDGVRTGTSQRLNEVTLTPEVSLSDHLLIRLDIRHDWSSRKSFDNAGESDDRQTTGALNAIYHF